MKMILVLFVGLIIFVAGCTKGGEIPEDKDNETEIPKVVQAPDVYTTTQLKENYENLINQTVKVSGKVTFIYKCGSCPPGAMCSPCMNHHISLSDGETVIGVGFFDSIDYYNSLETGDQITIEVKVTDWKKRSNNYIFVEEVGKEIPPSVKEIKKDEIPSPVLSKYEELKGKYSKPPLPISISLCEKDSESIYVVSLDQSPGHDNFYYDINGKFLGDYQWNEQGYPSPNGSLPTSKKPEPFIDLSKYKCTTVKGYLRRLY